MSPFTSQKETGVGVGVAEIIVTAKELIRSAIVCRFAELQSGVANTGRGERHASTFIPKMIAVACFRWLFIGFPNARGALCAERARPAFDPFPPPSIHGQPQTLSVARRPYETFATPESLANCIDVQYIENTPIEPIDSSRWLLFFWCDIDLVVEAHPLYRRLEAILHTRVILVEFPRIAAILELHPVGILEVDGFRPVMINDFADLDALGEQLGTFLFQSRYAPGFEREMIEGARHAKTAIDAGVVFGRNAWNSACLHEGEQLIATGIEEDVANLAALLHRDCVAAYWFEAEHPLVKLARLVEVQGGEPDVRKSLMRH